MTTVAIIDFAHSGTTMLAGICEIMGVSMVLGNHHPIKWEDLDVIEALAQGDKSFAALVDRRDQEHNIWGFKYPGAWKFMPLLKVHLSDPIYLAIYKDPVSVTRRRFGKRKYKFPHKLRNTARQIRESIDGIYACGVPVHFLSYHKAIVAPEAFVQDVAIMVGVDVNDELVDVAANYIQPNTGNPRKCYPEIKSWI